MSPSADFNLRIISSLVQFVRERNGEDEVARVADAAGLEPGALGGASTWVDHQTLERLLEAVRTLFDSDGEFRDACAHGLERTNTPMRLLKGAIGPRDAYDLGARNMRALTSVSRFRTRREAGGTVVIRYESERPESRLMCLSRQAQMTRLPELWGLPPAHLTEKRCIAHGDDCCEYALNLYEPLRWLPVAIGLVVGASVGVAIGTLHLGSVLTVALLAVLGAATGYVSELRRANRINSQAARAINESVVGLAREEAVARREIFELTRRQHEWIGRLEEYDDERTNALEQLARGLDTMRSRWVTSIRGFSHDLRNPLTVLKTNVVYMRDTQALDEEGTAVLEDIDQAVVQMEKMLTDLSAAAKSDFGSVRLEPEDIDTQKLVHRIRIRINALVYGHEVRASVLTTREAPPKIRCDPLLLDRVLDNLLTNAAKYTDRGSIVVELDGTPGFLTVKISDTGRGINETEIEKAFVPGGSRVDSRAGNGWGVGLSVVVQLLARVGGRLEVMSRPGMGTTFWAHFPVNPREPNPKRAERESEAELNLAQVVSIRKRSA